MMTGAKCLRGSVSEVSKNCSVIFRKSSGSNARFAFLQGTLMAALDRFFSGREHLAVEFASLMSNPRREVERLMDYLQITADAEKVAAAIRFIEPGRKSKVEIEQGEKIGAESASAPGTVWGALRKAITGRGQ